MDWDALGVLASLGVKEIPGGLGHVVPAFIVTNDEQRRAYQRDYLKKHDTFRLDWDALLALPNLGVKKIPGGLGHVVPVCVLGTEEDKRAYELWYFVGAAQ